MRRIKFNNDISPIEKIPDIIPFAGIYLLFQAGDGKTEVVYIGKSKNIRWRLIEHSKSKFMYFNYFNYGFCPIREIDDMEKKILGDYVKENGRKPIYNKQLG